MLDSAVAPLHAMLSADPTCGLSESMMCVNSHSSACETALIRVRVVCVVLYALEDNVQLTSLRLRAVMRVCV